MAFGRPRPVQRNRRGELELHLPSGARQVLAQLCAELRELLGTDDPSLRRLFPTAYADDAERDAEYQILARSELVDRRLAALSRIEETVEARTLEEDDVAAWMHGINQLRLVLGTRLGVSEDELPETPPLDHPDAATWANAWAAYEFLSALLDAFVEAESS
ncbi:MAG: DUF2017 family protein [Acidimicrobiia bacterium]|nr:DUF2017 family protein [Acidimicrobiia bacterium]